MAPGVPGLRQALRDRLTGTFVDRRITPKGKAATGRLPFRVPPVHGALAIGAALPVPFVGDLSRTRGFLLPARMSAPICAVIVVVIVWHHMRDNRAVARPSLGASALRVAAALATVLVIAAGFASRGVESPHALACGPEPLRPVRADYGIAGAGAGTGKVRFRRDPGRVP